jgi:hypothetical protein
MKLQFTNPDPLPRVVSASVNMKSKDLVKQVKLGLFHEFPAERLINSHEPDIPRHFVLTGKTRVSPFAIAMFQKNQSQTFYALSKKNLPPASRQIHINICHFVC